jgi:NAD(P)-dependent dehydrogenase (short-subunit alcohol dehydrogenase family)
MSDKHQLTRTFRAAGLGKACVEEICKHGGYAAILDMNEDLGNAVVKELGSSTKFWRCDVSDTESISAAVKGAIEWSQQTAKPIGGVIPAAGVGNPCLV